MANKRKFVCREELDSETAPLPHPDPLGSVMHAKAFLSQTITVETDRPVDPAHVDLITRAMRFAQLLLLHPDSIGKLASIYANKPGPQPLIEKAIRRVLGTTQWAVGLDSYVVLACLASHSRPAREDLSEVYTLAELTIFLNPTVRLLALYVQRVGHEEGQAHGIWVATYGLRSVKSHADTTASLTSGESQNQDGRRRRSRRMGRPPLLDGGSTRPCDGAGYQNSGQSAHSRAWVVLMQ